MRSKTANRTLTLLTTTSLLALGLAMAPITVDFDLHKPVLKAAQAKGGGEGGEGGSGGGAMARAPEKANPYNTRIVYNA